MNKIIVIDGNSLLFRAYYATYNPDSSLLMHTKEGIPTNAIFAFSNMLTSLLSSLNKEDGIFVAFDKGKHTFRHQKYEEYKANRAPTPKDLLEQMPIARELLDCLNIKYYEDDNIEADDIAGIVAKNASKEGYKVYIYTSDKDYLQLISENITVKLIKRGLKDIVEYTPSSFKEEWGFNPINIIDYKGLMGDPSDNLKGIPKVGDKTAKQLIIKYGTLEEILIHKDECSKSLKENLTNYASRGKLCKELATINLDYEIPVTTNETIYLGYDFNKISTFASKYEFKNLINKLPTKLKKEQVNDEKVEFEIVSSLPTINIKEIGFSVDIGYENYHKAKLYGIAFTINNKNYYIEENNIKDNIAIKELLENKEIKKYCYDFKLNRCVLKNYGINVEGLFFDLLLGSYLVEPTIKNDIVSCLAYFKIDASYCLNSESLFDESNKEKTVIQSYYSLKLYDHIKELLEKVNQLDLLNNIELPLSIVLSDIEIEGFPLNKESLLKYGEEIKGKLNEIKKDIYFYATHEFNINSPKELANVLYNELGLKDNKKHSTSVEYLVELKKDHPIIECILMYRKYSKILSTYVVGFIPYIENDNKIHATFNQALTTTGRLSSSEPNLQNISIRDEEGKLVRRCFFYDDPTLNILSLDYSQIELRILASLSNCTTLIDAFNNDVDIHSLTAKKIFKLDREPTSAERRKAKAVNFGIVYGISDFGLSEQIDVSIKEAREIIMSFYESFPEIKDYLQSSVQQAMNNGYTTTLFNRRRYLNEFNSSDYKVREFAKRASMNAPIQGSAADLIKIAMINVASSLKEHHYEAKIISQIHDELLIKVNDKEKEEVYKLVKNIMENSIKLNVKLKVDGGYAKTWFDAK